MSRVSNVFRDLTSGYRLEHSAFRHGTGELQARGLRAALLAVLVAMIALPLAQPTKQIVASGINTSLEMARYLDEHVPAKALINPTLTDRFTRPENAAGDRE